MSIVVFVLIDGLRPDAITPDRCPNLTALRARGAWTVQAQSVMPSITFPCHMSIFHSVPPSLHHITTNDPWPPKLSIPGLIELAHAANRRSAFFYNWEPLRNLSHPTHLSLSYFRDNCKSFDGDELNAVETIRLIKQIQPDFAFVYFGNVDEIGHGFGWMSDEYLTQVNRADKALGTVLSGLPADSAVLLQSDHGGHNYGHGTEQPEDMTIPWVVAGPGVRQNYEIRQPVSLLDTAPTLARLLGLSPHPEWQGRCIEEIFEDGQNEHN